MAQGDIFLLCIAGAISHILIAVMTAPVVKWAVKRYDLNIKNAGVLALSHLWPLAWLIWVICLPITLQDAKEDSK